MPWRAWSRRRGTTFRRVILPEIWTALLYGIKTDTLFLERGSNLADLGGMIATAMIVAPAPGKITSSVAAVFASSAG